MNLKETTYDPNQGFNSNLYGVWRVTQKYDCGMADVLLFRKIAWTCNDGLPMAELNDDEQRLAREILQGGSGAITAKNTEGSDEQRLFIHPQLAKVLGRFSIQYIRSHATDHKLLEGEMVVQFYDQSYGGYLEVPLTQLDLKGLPEVTVESVTKFAHRVIMPLLEKWVPARSVFRY